MSAATRRLGNGATETPVRNAAGELVGVVTRPRAGGGFFLHRAGMMSPRGEKFRTLREAIASALCPGGCGDQCCGSPAVCARAMGIVR